MTRPWLPKEVVPQAPRRRVLVLLALSVLAFVAVNFATREALLRWTTNTGYRLIAQKWRILDNLEQPVDWLIIGDSSCNQGIRPDILMARIGGTAVNLCTTAQMLVIEDAWMLQQYLEDHPPPSGGVIVMHVYDAWPGDSKGRGGAGGRGKLMIGMARIPLSYRFWKGMEPELEFPEEDHEDYLLARYFPLYAENKTLVKWVTRPGDTLDALAQQSIDDLGYMTMEEPNPKKVQRDYYGHVRFATKHRPKISAVNQLALKTMVALAEEHDFQLYLVSSPLYERLLAHPGYRKHYAGLQRGLEKLLAKSDNAHLAMPWNVGFERDEMENADHLTDPAAVRFTHILADTLEAYRQKHDLR